MAFGTKPTVPEPWSKDAKLAPNQITYNASISACASAGMWSQALHLFESMDANLAPGMQDARCQKASLWLDLWTLTFWEAVDFPLDPHKVTLVAEGSTATKASCVSA